MGFCGDPSTIIESATSVLEKANFKSKKGLFEQVLKQLSNLITHLNPDLLQNVVMKLTKFVFITVIERVGSLQVVKEGIFSNDINAATLTLIGNRPGELVEFLLDLFEAAKCYALANSESGIATADDARGQYNEFDFSDPMNRHAIICQIQRLVKSIVFVLRQVDKSMKFEDIDMTKVTTLPSDSRTPLGGTLKITREGKLPSEGSKSSPSASLHGQQEEEVSSKQVSNENWLFINGVAGERHWLRLACNKLKASFSREVTGIFNRGDGLLWDVIECAGERSKYVQNPGEGDSTRSPSAEDIVTSQRELIKRTSSSMEAQKTLFKELREAVSDAKNAYIIMVAHSQGCLILRHVLEDLVTGANPTEAGPTETNDADLSKLRENMRERLCVFTFGNPSLHWLTSSPNGAPGSKDSTQLSYYARRTEHFANSRDFVAKLGVLSNDKPSISGYGENEVFINEERDWIGHLFGTQYSLDPAHYKDGKKSWLLACRKGVPMKQVDEGFTKEAPETVSVEMPAGP